MGVLHRIDKALRTKESAFATGEEKAKTWGNEDLDPTP